MDIKVQWSKMVLKERWVFCGIIGDEGFFSDVSGIHMADGGGEILCTLTEMRTVDVFSYVGIRLLMETMKACFYALCKHVLLLVFPR